ncbi:MAG: hypothetical protein JNN15_18935, partial [Blastocatellia bacterium]|nr:hypothetical protein [Blastocatellia bacterium]
QLHWPRREEIFLGPKIFALRQTLSPLFSYCDLPVFVDLAVNIIRDRGNDGNFLKALTVYLNSDFVKKWLERNGKMKGKHFQIDQKPLSEIPVPADLVARGRMYTDFLGQYKIITEFQQE